MEDTRRLRHAILECLRQPGYRPADADEIQKRLRVPRVRRRSFNRALRDLIQEKLVVRVDRRRYAAADAKPGAPARAGTGPAPAPARTAGRPSKTAAPPAGRKVLIGTLQVHPRGFGFVTPDGGGRDLFIPPPGIGERADGDRVEAVVLREQSDGRLQGEIRRLVEATRRRVVGVYRVLPGGGGVVETYDRRYEGGIAIPADAAGGAVNGLVVGVAIDRPAEEGRRAWGRVVEVLGPQEAPETELRAIIRKYGLREEFPPDVLQAAGQAPDKVPAADLRGREDFRTLPIVTIDGETAMDFDDAIMVRRLPGGGYELQVHIADVAHYVHPATPLDAEAYERGTSVYFPGTALPMLPHRLSNGICSLNPGVDRLVLSCVMILDPGGEVTGYRLVEGVIRSAARMTYTNVAKILVDRDSVVSHHYRELVPGFLLMEELCGVLNARRRRRGSIDFDLPEPEVILAATGEMTGILALERNIAHRLIEEFMLAANETVARHLSKAKVPAIYRIHERPDPRRLEDFDAVAQAFGYALPRPFTSLQPGAFQGMLDRARGRPEERFLARLMLRSMKQARYSDTRDIHFGLASSCYTHFTSPIRRYPDLIVHRLVKRLLRPGPLGVKERADLEMFLPDAAARSSVRERTADAAENEHIERKKMAFMAGKIGEEFEGIISDVQPFGFFVELRDLFVSGLVSLESLDDDRYVFVERRRLLRGERRGRTLAMGDPVRVRVEKVNTFRMEIELGLLEARVGFRPAGEVAPVRSVDATRGRRRSARRQSERSRERHGQQRRAAPPGRRRRGR